MQGVNKSGGTSTTATGTAMRIAAIVALCGLGASAHANHSVPIYNATTGNHYAYVTAGAGGITWLAAEAEAKTYKRDNVPGHLAVITSAQENTFLVQNLLLMGRPGFPNGYPIAAADMYWLGGFQLPFSPEPLGNWTWVTGEPWGGYTNWEPLEPEPNDGDGGGEERLAFWRRNYQDPYNPSNPLQPTIGVWNDEPSWFHGLGYVIEWETPVLFGSHNEFSYAYVTGTRADPGPASTTAHVFKGLDLRPGSSFTLGTNETMNLDSAQGPLTVGTGSSFIANGAFQGIINSTGHVTIPSSNMPLLNSTNGGVVHAVTPSQSLLIDPGMGLHIHPQTMFHFNGAGFAGTHGGGPTGTAPGNFLLDSYLLTNEGTFAWDGRIFLTGAYEQEATGTLRVYVAGENPGVTHSVLNAQSGASLNGVIQVVLQPDLFNYVPDVGDTFDVVLSDAPIDAAPTLTVQTLMTASGAASLGLTLPPFATGFGSDPNQLVSVGSNLFTYALVNGGTRLRLTLAQPLCVPVTGPASSSVCGNENVSFSVVSKGSGPTTYAWRKDGVALNTGTHPSAATSTLSIMAAGMAGQYDCVITSPCGSVTSSAATLSVGGGLSTSNPSAVVACVGSPASFGVTASGTGPFTYQWRKNSSPIGGANSATLDLATVAQADAGDYDCVVTGACGSVTSGAALLTVNTAPATSSPSPVTSCVGSPASFSVTASGTGPFTYQWRLNGAPIGSATASTYAIASVNEADAGNYDCLVTGACGSVTSDAAALAVSTATTTSNPSPATACVGTPASFSVTPSGTGPFTFEWRLNGSPIGGATSASYAIASVVEGDAGTYDCVVTGACGNVTSATAMLTVNTATTTSNPSPVTACVGSPASFSVTASGTGPFTYQWRLNENPIGGATASSFNIAAIAESDAGNYDCVITGSCGSITSGAAALVVNTAPATTNPSPVTACVGSPASFAVTASGTGPFIYQWRLNASPIEGATDATYSIATLAEVHAGNYDCVVTGTCGSITSDAAALVVNTAPSTTNPSAVAACVGAPASFSVTASGTGPFTYQWRFNSGPIEGATGASHQIAAVGLANAGSYDCVVTGACGSVTSTAAVLTVNTAPSSSSPDPVTACVGSPASFGVTASGTGPFTYQWRRNAATIEGATASTYAIPSLVESDAGSYDCVITNVCSSVTSPAAALVVNTAPTTSSPSNATACVGTPASFSVTPSGTAPFTFQWRKNSNPIEGATGSTLNIASVALADAGNYDCVVTNACSNVTSGTASLTVNTSPTSSSPAPVTTCLGEPASFLVVAEGTGPFTYQWRLSGSPIDGATNAAYSIAAVAQADAGAYDCVITGACGSVTSDAAALSVSNAPSISTQPQPLDVLGGSTATFTVAVTGTSPITYQWRKDSVPLTDSESIVGSTTASLSIDPALLVDEGAYDVIVTNTCGTIISDSALLEITLCPADLDDGTGANVPDGGVDISDLLFFLQKFQEGHIAADLDNDGDPAVGVPDGGVDINDLLFFLVHFESGC